MLHKIKDLDERVDTGTIVEWRSPQGTRYRYERERCRVGKETSNFGEFIWFLENVRDKREAKRAVFDAINADEA